MPYSIRKTSSGCPADKPWGLYLKDNGKRLGCHETKEDAEAQMRAIEAHKHSNG